MIPKFRAWDKEENRMTEINSLYFPFDSPSGKHLTIQAIDGHEWRDIEEVELMQYTGLKDKNGVEVYINDIVEDEHGHRYEVVFEGDCLRCNGVRRVRGGHKPKNRWFSKGLEIIGNRYEHPELLEETNAKN